MINIVPYQDSYFYDVCEINHLNSSHPDRSGDEKEFCIYLYVAYYLKYEKENCFIAIDSDSKQVLGYILATLDYDTYFYNIMYDYLETAEIIGFKDLFISEIQCYKQFKKEYPAHFHIDVRPGQQNKGIGSLLLNKEIINMRKNSVNGLMLFVGKNKIAGNSFYEKKGFKIIMEFQDLYARGKKL